MVGLIGPIIRRRPSPAMVVASIALIVALGGTGYAASKLPTNSVGSKQIKKNAVTSSKVKDRSLRAKDFAAGQIPKGPTGPAGAAGAAGATGATGPSGVVGATVFGPTPGALPKSFNLVKKRADTDLLITWSGSGFRSTANASATLNLILDGGDLGSSTLYFNLANVHMAFPTETRLASNRAPGSHPIALVAGGGLLTDSGDQFTITVLEVKPSG